MSKLFDQSRAEGQVRAQDDDVTRWVANLQGSNGAAASETETETAKVADSGIAVVDELVRGDTLATDLAFSRLRQCRKIAFPDNPELLGFSDEHEEAALAVESFRMVRTRLLRIQAALGLCSVVVTSAEPGEGKTTTSINLAACCAQMPRVRVLLIDGDLRTGGLSERTHSADGPGFSDLLAGTATYEQAIAQTKSPGLYVMGAGQELDIAPTELFTRSSFKELIAWGSEVFNLIIIDSTPIGPMADFELLSAQADGILGVVRAHRSKRDMVEQSFARIDKKKLIGTVFNGGTVHRYNGYYNSKYYYGKSKPSGPVAASAKPKTK